MCGITGLHCKQHLAGQDGAALLFAMSEKLSHRGPDGEGLHWFDAENFGLAHRRLSIIDLSLAASQPMVIEAPTVLLCVVSIAELPDATYTVVLESPIRTGAS